MSNYTKTTNFAAKDSLPSGNAAKIVKGSEIDTEFNNIATASATKADKNNATLTGTTAFETISDGTIAITGFVDEDNMASDSAALLPTQQSVKAYVDSQVTAQDLDFQADTGGALSIDLDSETLTLTGGTGIDTSGLGNAVTFAIDSTVATLTGTQTLSNKTLSAPAVSGNLTTDGLIDGRDVATDGTKLDGIESGATADQTAAEIKTAYESNADTNAFTDADESKLDGIEALADVTDTTNVTAAGALMDSELTSEAAVKALNQGVATTDSPTFAGVTAPVTGNVTGNLTGNVTGNVTGNLTGDVTGDVTGDLTGSVLTAAQTNITSVGTLGSLTVSGDVTVDTNTLKVDSTNNRVGVLNATPDVTLDIGSATDAVHVPTGTTAQRPTGAAGYFRYNSSLEQFEGYTTEWGSIGGGGGTNTFTTDSFTGDGTTVAYALSQTVSSEDNLLVFIEGVFQQQDAYSIATASGVTTLTFSAAPANGNSILIYSVAAAVSGSNLNIDSMTGDGSTVALTLSIAPVNENNTQVFIDGVYQNKSTYSISGTTLTFSTAPPNGSAVEVMTMTQTDINVPVDNSITSAKLSGDLVTPGALTVTTDLTVDTDTLYVDSTNNLVGIGTTSPDRPLHIAGNPAMLLLEDTGGGTDDKRAQLQVDSGVFEINSRNDDNSSRVDNIFIADLGTGNVGIGTSSPSAQLQLTGDIWTGAGTAADPSIKVGDNNTGFYYVGGNVLGITTNGAERARIDASGNLLVGTTSSTVPHTLTSGSGGAMWNNSLYISIARTSDSLFLNRLGSDGGVARFYRDGVNVGNISVTTSGTSYDSPSDQRLKENIADADDAGNKIDAIQVRKFDWIADGSHQDYGMIAQELQTVAPEAVSGDADSDEMMGVDYSKLVPMLVKEIQSLRARVQQLENN